MLTYKEIKDDKVLEEQSKNKIIHSLNKERGENVTVTYNLIQGEHSISDAFIYEVVKGTDKVIKQQRKKVDVKYKVISSVYERPYERDMTELLKDIKDANHNQVTRYLEEENMVELVPSKITSIERRIVKALNDNPQEYTTQGLIKELELNRKTFYKLFNQHPEWKELFRYYSDNAKDIKELVDSKEDKTLTIAEIAKELGISSIVVKNNLNRLDYMDKILVKTTMTEKVVTMVKKYPNKYSIMEISEETDVPYNTAYKIVKRHDLLDSVINTKK